MGHKNIVRALTIACLLGSLGLTVGGNSIPVMTALQRTPTGNSFATYTPWIVCVQGKCSFNDNDSVGCTELSSRLHVMAAFSVIHGLSVLVMILILAAEIKKFRLPVQNLNYYMLLWTNFSILIVWPLILGTLLANLCGNAANFQDLGGTLATGFYLLLAASLLCIVISTVYFVASNVREREVSNYEDDDEDESGKTQGRGGNKQQGQGMSAPMLPQGHRNNDPDVEL